MQIVYRPATPQDAPYLAKISLLASGGTFELLLQGLKRNVTPLQVLTLLSSVPNTEYSYNYFLVAEVDGQVAGGVNYISKEDRYELAENINPLLKKHFQFGLWQLAKFYVRARHLKGMNVLKVPPKSLHINDIAVFPEFQGLKIGGVLLGKIIEIGKQQGFDYISLYVWADNTGAINFYHKHGFTIAKTAAVRPHQYLPHSQSHLMLLPLT